MSALPEPSWRLLLGRGLPNFALEGFVPVLVFYGVWRAGGLGAGIAASAAGGGQALVALVAHSATLYLAQPVLFSACWGIAYLVSAAIGRPLIGVFARAWYPFPPEFRASEAYLREFGMQSVVWGVYCLARAALRLGVLVAGSVGGFVLVSFLSGTPILAVLVLWGIWHARRAFGVTQPVSAGGATSRSNTPSSWRNARTDMTSATPSTTSAVLNVTRNAGPAPAGRVVWYTVISTAAPMAEPIRCPVCRAPPAAPPIRGGTSARVSVMFGDTTAPPPNPVRNISGAATQASPLAS